MTDTLITLPSPDTASIVLPPSPGGYFTLAEVSEKIDAATQKYINAIEIIADALADEAKERDWCSEYDEFVDNVNRRLPDGVGGLEYAEQLYSVEFRVTLRRSQITTLESDIDKITMDMNGHYTEDFSYDPA